MARSFTQWIEEQRFRKDQIGNLGDTIHRDRCWPDFSEFKVGYLAHLIAHQYDEALIETFETAWEEWRDQEGKVCICPICKACHSRGDPSAGRESSIMHNLEVYFREGEEFKKLMISEAQARFGADEIGEVLAVCGSWAVTTYGLTCLTRSCRVSKPLLQEPFKTLDHINRKGWVNMTDFVSAFVLAQRLLFQENQEVSQS